MLIQKIFEVSLCVLSVYILYYWIIIIMGKSKHERSKTNMLCSLKTVVVLIPTSHNGLETHICDHRLLLFDIEGMGFLLARNRKEYIRPL